MLSSNKFKHESIKISLVYFFLGILWILFSDKLANILSQDKETLTLISTYKGWFYVIITALLLYYLLERMLKQILSAELIIVEKNHELLAAHQELEVTNEEISQQYDELRTYITQLRINQARLNRAQAIAHVGNWELDLDNKTIWASAEAFKIYGTTSDTVYLPLEKVQNMVNPEDRPYMDSALSHLISGQGFYDVVFRINRESDGAERIVHSIAVLEENYKARPTKVLGVIRDITEQHLAEKQMKYYAEHDAVTGLFNRRYFEQEMLELAKKTGTIGIIICDIDGLKLVNDTMGHHEGDKYLILCSEILMKSCPADSIISRIGGDEFVIILYDVKEEDVTQVYRAITKKVEDYNSRSELSIPLSISLGTTFCQSCTSESITQALKETEEKMYFNKLLHGQSNRSRTVDILMKTLEARDYITEGHTDRIQKMVEGIAIKIGMNELEKSKLSLFARFHDIGKVGTPDSILFKPGKLDSAEFEEMKKHCEIGYRIANSSPDLAPISEYILKHHEWWNGLGYPLGIAGENIPIQCRILAIADAYDCMSNDRPYRKALSYHERIAELKRFSGIQFDPDLVNLFIDSLGESEASSIK